MERTITWEGFLKNMFWLMVSFIFLSGAAMAFSLLYDIKGLDYFFHIFQKEAVRLFYGAAQPLRFYLFYHEARLLLFELILTLFIHRLRNIAAKAMNEEPFAAYGAKTLRSLYLPLFLYLVFTTLFEVVYPKLFAYTEASAFFQDWKLMVFLITQSANLYKRIFWGLGLTAVLSYMSALLEAVKS